LPDMRPFASEALTARQFALADPGRHYLVYSSAAEAIRLDLSADRATFTARRIHPGRAGRPAGRGRARGPDRRLPGPGIRPRRAVAGAGRGGAMTPRGYRRVNFRSPLPPGEG
jgi:hypothetical protein